MLQLSEVGYKNKAERSISLYVDPFVMFVCLFMQSNILTWFNCNNRHLVLACWIRKEVKVTKVIIVFWTFVGHTDKLPVFWNSHFWGQHFSNNYKECLKTLQQRKYVGLYIEIKLHVLVSVLFEYRASFKRQNKCLLNIPVLLKLLSSSLYVLQACSDR